MKRITKGPSALGILICLAVCLSVLALPGPKIRELRVLVLADEEFRRDLGWKFMVTEIMAEASFYFEKNFGLRLAVSEFRDWQSDKAFGSVEMVAENLVATVAKFPFDILLAFVGQRIPDMRHNACSLFKESIIVMTGNESVAQMTSSLKHELGHLFAAAHVDDPASLMGIFSRGEEFDARNAELIRLNRDRSFHGHRFPLSKENWERTIALWREIAQLNDKAWRRRKASGQIKMMPAQEEEKVGARRRDLDDVHLLLAQLLIEQERYPEALGECQEALRLTSESLEALNFSGIALRRSGRVDEAIEKYLTILKRKPAHPQTLYNLGIAYSKKGNLRKAEESYRRAVEARPRFAEALSNLGELYLRLGRTGEAESELQNAVKADPFYPAAYNNLAEVEFRRKEFGKAMELVNRALSLDPESPGAHNMRGKILRQRRDLAGAKEEFRKALLVRPNDEKALHNLGNCFLDEKNLAEARELYARAAEIDPHFAEPHEGLGVCWLLEGKLEEAVAEFRLALKLGLRSESLHVNLSSALLRKGLFGQAADEARKALEISPSSSSAHNNLGMALLQKGAISEAAAEFQSSLDCEPENKEALINLGNLFLGQEDWERALGFYLRALAVDPANAVLHNNIAVIYFKQGEYAKSWTHLQRAEELGFEPHPDFREELKKKIRRIQFESDAYSKLYDVGPLDHFIG